MRNAPELAESALVSPAWVENALGVSRQTRLDLERKGVLTVVRLTPNSHRRYHRAEIEALVNSPEDADAAASVRDAVAAIEAGAEG